MRKIKSKYKILFIIIINIIIVFTISCNKEPDEIGLNLQAPNDKLNVKYNDTTTMVSYSKLEDSIKTNETSLSLLGSYFDPVFGKCTASIYTQLHLSKSDVDFGENPQLDSLVLTLVYEGYYGDTTTLQTLKVYEITEDMYRDTSYYSNQNLAFDQANEITNFVFTPKPNDSVMIDSVKYAPELRINLSSINPDFGNKILNAAKTDLSDNDNFVKFIKGLYITTEPVNIKGEGAILYFNLVSSSSKMTIYYSNKDNDSLKLDFVINNYCARYTNFNHYGYTDADQYFKEQVINGDTGLGNNNLYLQSMAGVKTKIMFPFIKNWFNSEKIAINKAQLVININKTDLSQYEAPLVLALVKLDKDGKYENLADKYEGDEYFGGTCDSINNEYRFRITRYIQKLLKGEEDYGLYLIVSGRSIKANRAVLIGPSPNPPIQFSDRSKLELIYTELKE